MSHDYTNPADFQSHLNDNNSKLKLINNSSKLRSDSNNNANGIYDYQSTSYDDQTEDKTNLGLNNNAEDYYKMYDEKDKDDRHYEEEFDNEYAQNSVTMSKQIMHKQMSILDDDDAHQHNEYMDDMMLNEEQKAIDEEYLDEFEEEDALRKKSTISNGFMKKQESIMEDDPELKQLEETQNLKNQHQHFQEPDLDNELDQFNLELKQKKSVTICDEEIVVHEKPREKRTAKQRWHWAYNRIVHQAQVSTTYAHFLKTFLLTNFVTIPTLSLLRKHFKNSIYYFNNFNGLTNVKQ
jgi:hypothetical protein